MTVYGKARRSITMYIVLKAKTLGEFDGNTSDFMAVYVTEACIKNMIELLEQAEAERKANDSFFRKEFWDFSPEFFAWDYDSEDDGYLALQKKVDDGEAVVCEEIPVGEARNIDVRMISVTYEGIFWSGKYKHTNIGVETVEISKVFLLRMRGDGTWQLRL
jgi:hypothetical protein